MNTVLDVSKGKFKGVYGEGRINNERVILLKPLTYMNLSGESIKAVSDFSCIKFPLKI